MTKAKTTALYGITFITTGLAGYLVALPIFTR